MELRRVGSSGLKVSALGLGCNNFGRRLDQAASHRVIHAALDQGVTLFDTADVYGGAGGSESHLGTGLGARRQDIVLATKFGMAMQGVAGSGGGSRGYIVKAVEASLRRLKTDWIDLLQLHRPDPDSPIEETLAALDDLIRAGKLRYIGSSNFAAWQVVEAQLLARELGLNRFVTTQEEYSLVSRAVEFGTTEVCRNYGVGVLPFFPLASGLLTGKYAKGQPAPEGTRMAGNARMSDTYLTEANFDRVARWSRLAEAEGREILDLAFAWLLRDPVVPSVIAGATSAAQVERNAKAAAWRLPEGLAEKIG